MSPAVGSVVEGKVIRIKPFGAIVSLEDNTQGLVHISQVSSSYVQNINDYLKVGDTVTVKVLSVDAETKKISLSMREAEKKPPKNEYKEKAFEENNHREYREPKPQTNTTLEEKLKDWLKQANERQAGLNKRNNRR